MNSESSWGASNLVVIPYGGWSAQDYCLENVVKTGDKITADFKTSPKLKMLESISKIRDGVGKEYYRVNYVLTPSNGGQASYEKVYLFFPFASKDFAGGKVILDDGTEVALPEEVTPEIRLPHKTKSITLSNGKTSFTVKSSDLQISLKDLRPKTTAFHIWLEYPNPQNVTSMKLQFDVSAELLPYVVKGDDTEWTELPFSSRIEEGSILDFSFLNDAPAGKYGRIVNKDGHFAYEGNGNRVKLIGTNLCYTANYLEKSEADRIAEHFKKTGYNAVRFHHTDVHMRKGNWKSDVSDDVDPAYLDKLDYMFAAMKKAGMYVAIDLYTQRRFDKGEIAGIDKVIEGEIKGLVPIHEPAFEAWKKLVVKWMNHVNPYTGIAWKEDPALLMICPLNEDSIASSWGGRLAKPFYLERFAEWKKERNLTSAVDDPKQDTLFAQFLIEVKMESNRKIEKFLRGLGVKAMLTGSNWWHTMPQTFTRNQFDLVDNHQYSDHPQPHYNQQSNLNSSHYTYITPIFMASTRIFGKPFTVTEYSYCAPNKYRAEGGALMGAYASLQDWDALYRFAWAHDEKRVNETQGMQGFDMSSDPLNQLTEKQIVLMFRRGDVAPGAKKYVYGVAMQEATRQGVGDMWVKGIFPHSFNALALISQTGSQVIEGSRKIEGEFDGVVADSPPTDNTVLNGNKFIAYKDISVAGDNLVSDTGEITLDKTKCYIKIQSPKTECIVASEGIDISAGNLSVRDNNYFCSLSASSMDDNNLSGSRRVLLFHLTNVLNTEMKFASKDMTTLIGWGKLPYLVHMGAANVSLKNSNSGMKLYACDFTGKRVKEVKTDYKDGAYTLKAEISAGNPYMIYELTEK
ncbi:MAG: hypothetical protein A2X45_15305 [Lentisphaerae bacterium GWF2_50_93]|nr:MAG: hypothetical protein A2X45_15305 [Lentisphaerae bacterium GWF2_50_93]